MTPSYPTLPLTEKWLWLVAATIEPTTKSTAPYSSHTLLLLISLYVCYLQRVRPVPVRVRYPGDAGALLLFQILYLHILCAVGIANYGRSPSRFVVAE